MNPGYIIKSFLLYKITAKSLDSITLGSPLFWKREKIKSFLCCTGVCSLMPLACKISSFHQPCFFFSLGVWCSNLDWKGFYLHKHTLCSLDAPVCYTFSPFFWEGVFPFSFFLLKSFLDFKTEKPSYPIANRCKILNCSQMITIPSYKFCTYKK